MTKKLALIAIALGLLGLTCGIALADPPTLPSDTDPRAAFDDFKALYKIGWPITVLAGMAVAARLLGRLGKLGGRWKPLAVLGEGKVAAVIAAVGALAASAFDVLALGGSWGSVVAAVAMGGLALWDAASKPKLIAGDLSSAGN